MVEQEASVLLADSRGLTSIHLAAACGHASWLVELLSIACSELSSLPPLRDHSGYTPLHWACHFGSVPVSCTLAVVLWSPVCLRLCFKDSKCPLRVHAQDQIIGQLELHLEVIIVFTLPLTTCDHILTAASHGRILFFFKPHFLETALRKKRVYTRPYLKMNK